MIFERSSVNKSYYNIAQRCSSGKLNMLYNVNMLLLGYCTYIVCAENSVYLKLFCMDADKYSNPLSIMGDFPIE